ncbi:MAG TPA: Yip1 family protein [Gemmatimonadales bacterium]|nr:Yip1 family protein [Gemmatimonadales bacterium]
MSLIERVKAILLTPQKEWHVIDGESATVASLFTGYIMPLAAIPAIAEFVRFSMIGYGVLGSTIRVPLVTGLSGAVVRYVATLAGVYVLALIVDALAPNFGGTKSQIQALKLAAYASTASWVAGIFMLIPGLGILTILGLYSLYLLFLGLPILMKSPEDKSLGYTVVTILCGIVVYFVIGAVAARTVGYGSWY